MSLRTETIAVGLVRGAPQLYNVYGFGWNAGAAENTVPSTNAVVAEVEYDHGPSSRRVLLRPGAWFGGSRLMTRVWFTATAAGNAVVDSGDEPEDRLTSADGPVLSPRWDEALLSYAESPNGVGADMSAAGAFGIVLSRPAWARRFVAWGHASQFKNGGAFVAPQFAVWYRNRDGSRWPIAWGLTYPTSVNTAAASGDPMAGGNFPVPKQLAQLGESASTAAIGGTAPLLVDPSVLPHAVELRIYHPTVGVIFDPAGTYPLRAWARWEA